MVINANVTDWAYWKVFNFMIGKITTITNVILESQQTIFTKQCYKSMDFSFSTENGKNDTMNLLTVSLNFDGLRRLNIISLFHFFFFYFFTYVNRIIFMKKRPLLLIEIQF